jgi:DNA replication ATP-dependent helicase Dna2
LSRIAFISRGCRVVLGEQGVPNVASLAGLASTALQFDQHQALRAARTVLPRRASSLLDDTAGVAPESGSSGVMPRYADLRVYITCDFDLGSAISLCFGVKAFWREKRAFNNPNPNPRAHHAWDARVFLLPERSLDQERRQFLAFLDHLHAILNDTRFAANRPDLQVYIWDKLTYKHLCRVIGRHLNAVLAQRNLAYLAWLFPGYASQPSSRRFCGNCRSISSLSSAALSQGTLGEPCRSSAPAGVGRPS